MHINMRQLSRRNAKTPQELIAEIPHHMRRRSTLSHAPSLHAPSSSVNKHTNNKNNKQQSYHIRSDLSKPRLIRSNNNHSSIGGGSHVSNYYSAHDMHRTHKSKSNPRVSAQLIKPLLIRSTHSPIHRRQHAMVWDDLVSVLRIEVMEDTPLTLQSCTDEVSHTNNSSIELQLVNTDNLTPSNNTNNLSIELVLVDTDNNKIPTPFVNNNITPLKSPPKTRRLSMCFDGQSNMSNNRGLSTIGRMVRRLSPMARRLSPPVVLRRRMSFKFGCRGSNPSGSVAQYSRSDTYISDSEDDSSLDYSDDEEDVEAAIMASVAVFSQSTNLEDKSEEFVDIECAICLGGCTDSSNIATINGCNHSFCFKCIDEWATKKNECPLCKEEFHLVTSNSKVRWY